MFYDNFLKKLPLKRYVQRNKSFSKSSQNIVRVSPLKLTLGFVEHILTAIDREYAIF